jgi:hypothetical protein
MLENATTARSLRLLPLEEARSRLGGAAAEAVGAESLVLGSSREGRPIELVRFGSGEQRVLWYAGPHANEPIGVTTIVELAERLVARPDLLAGPIGWDLVLNVDPDGHVRNEAWMDTPSDIQSYFRHFFRPPIAEYPDWDLPLHYESDGGRIDREPAMPEGRALLSALEISRPVAIVALHNAEIGGLHFYVTGPEGLVDRYVGLLQSYGMPVEERPVDDPAAARLAPGVFEMPRLDAVCEQLLASGHPDPASLLPMGDLAGNWAHKQLGTTSVIAEIPLWSVTSPLTTSAQDESELALQTAGVLQSEAARLKSLVGDHAASFGAGDPLARGTLDGISVLSQMAAGLEAWSGMEALRRPVTEDAIGRYQVFLQRALPQRYWGMALQTLLAAGAPDDAVRRAQEAFDAGLRELLSLELVAHPLEKLVELQIDSGLQLIQETLQCDLRVPPVGDHA